MFLGKRPLSFPDIFNAIYETPLALIRPTKCWPAYGLRLAHRDMPWCAFVLVDGACPNNGRPGAQGGWAVVYGRQTEFGPPRVVSGRLEDRGPFGGPDVVPTSNRAELRASIAALRLCGWRAEGFSRLVIATDSAYVADGATTWSQSWTCNGWITSGGAPVQNRDLWELLLDEIALWSRLGLLVLFWKIPRELNHEADAAAKAASLYGFREPEFVDWMIRELQPPNSPKEIAPVKPWDLVLVLCADSKALVDGRYQPLLSRIHRHIHLEVGQTMQQSIRFLEEDPAPSVILITDNTICRDATLFSLIRTHLRKGCVVVLAGDFSRCFVEDVHSVFDKFGVAWRLGDIADTEVVRRFTRRSGFSIDQPRLSNMLPLTYNQCGRLLTHVPLRETVYAQDSIGQTPTAVAKIGQGYLCFVDDEAPQSEDIIMAMCFGL